MKTRPTEAMAAVIKLMKLGWKLYNERTIDGSSWVAEPGRSGHVEWRTVNTKTFYGLRDREFIALEQSKFPVDTYRLTEEGKNAV